MNHTRGGKQGDTNVATDSKQRAYVYTQSLKHHTAGKLPATKNPKPPTELMLNGDRVLYQEVHGEKGILQHAVCSGR